MKSIHTKNYFQLLIRLLTVLVIVAILTENPKAIFSIDTDHNKGRPQEFDTQIHKKADSIAWYKRFQIELYGGFTTLRPNDFNLLVDYDNRIQEFFYESLLDYLQSNGQIRSWGKIQDEERRKIKNAFPLGGRLKYHVNSSIAVSLGFRYFTRTHESDFEFQYDRNEISGDIYTENMMYSPYSLSVKAYVPQVGIHLLKKIKSALTIEGFLSGGLLFVECHYLSDWSYEWRIREENFQYLDFRTNGALDEKGTGTGIAVDLGGRINYPLIKNLKIFLEGGYAYQVVKNVSGPGIESREDSSETWDGRWAIKQETINAPWGELDAEFPTNYWPNDPNEGKVRDFELNLSGFQLRLGLSFRL